jgi:hypothetical protein
MAHRASSFFRRSSLNRLVNPAVMGDGVLTFLRINVRDSDRSPSGASTGHVEGPYQSDKNRIPASFGNRKMKRAVPPYPVRVIDDLGGPTHTSFYPCNVFVSRLVRCDRRNRGFESKAHLHGITRARARETAVDSGRRTCWRMTEDGAIPATAPQPAIQFQLSKILTQSTPADAEFDGQLSFRWQAITILQALSFNICLNGIQDVAPPSANTALSLARYRLVGEAQAHGGARLAGYITQSFSLASRDETVRKALGYCTNFQAG